MYLSIGIFLPNCSFPFSLPTLQFSLNVTAGESLFQRKPTAELRQENGQVPYAGFPGLIAWALERK